MQKHRGNYGVICGETSNNLVIVDLDFKDDNKRHFERVLEEFRMEHPELAEPYMVETPYGYHLYYYTDGFVVKRCQNKNRTSDNIKTNSKETQEFGKRFVGTTSTRFSAYLSGVDFLGSEGYRIIPPSSVDRLNCVPYNNNPIKTITSAEFERIRSFFVLKRPKRMRKAFVDMLNGKINIEELSAETGIRKFQYYSFFISGGVSLLRVGTARVIRVFTTAPTVF